MRLFKSFAVFGVLLVAIGLCGNAWAQQGAARNNMLNKHISNQAQLDLLKQQATTLATQIADLNTMLQALETQIESIETCMSQKLFMDGSGNCVAPATCTGNQAITYKNGSWQCINMY